MAVTFDSYTEYPAVWKYLANVPELFCTWIPLLQEEGKDFYIYDVTYSVDSDVGPSTAYAG